MRYWVRGVAHAIECMRAVSLIQHPCGLPPTCLTQHGCLRLQNILHVHTLAVRVVEHSLLKFVAAGQPRRQAESLAGINCVCVSFVWANSERISKQMYNKLKADSGAALELALLCMLAWQIRDHLC